MENKFVDELIAELQAMKEDPEKDTVGRVIAMVIRVALKQEKPLKVKKGFIEAIMAWDGISKEEADAIAYMNAEENQ